MYFAFDFLEISKYIISIYLFWKVVNGFNIFGKYKNLFTFSFFPQPHLRFSLSPKLLGFTVYDLIFPSSHLLPLSRFGAKISCFVFCLTKHNGEDEVLAHTWVDTKVIGKWFCEHGTNFWSLKLRASIESSMADSWRIFTAQNRTIYCSWKPWSNASSWWRRKIFFDASNPIIVSICFCHYSLKYSWIFHACVDDSWDLNRKQQWYLELTTSMDKLGFEIG